MVCTQIVRCTGGDPEQGFQHCFADGLSDGDFSFVCSAGYHTGGVSADFTAINPNANFYSSIIFLVSRVHKNIYFNATITFTTRLNHKHFVIFQGKRGINCVNYMLYLEIISTSKNLTSATENETTKN